MDYFIFESASEKEFDLSKETVAMRRPFNGRRVKRHASFYQSCFVSSIILRVIRCDLRAFMRLSAR